MLRIHFTPDDLLRIRIAPSADPLWEVLLSLHRLPSRDGELAFGAWRRRVHTRLRQDGPGRSAYGTLAGLMPPARYIPDFLTPAEGGGGLEPGIDAIMSTPRNRLASELSRFATVSAAPPLASALAGAEPAALTRLGHALRTYHDAVLAPYWAQIEARVGADRAMRVQALADHGVEAMLAGFEWMRWRPPVLEVDYPVDQVLHLGGRGLVLMPSAFCWRLPVTLADPTLPPVLVYPASRHANWLGRTVASAAAGLGALVGPTRARILERLADKPSVTGELARLAGTTPATVSKHTAVLREAGLVASFQHGRYVCHLLTPLGTALVTAAGTGTASAPAGAPVSAPPG